MNIVAGNAPPTVTITSPARGGIFNYGENLSYQVTVTDPDDGTIDCGRVRVDTALGHDKHAHGDQNLVGCSGTLTIPGPWELKSEHSFFVLTATYMDKGVATPGLELEGTAQVVLEHRVQQAEFADARKGTQDVSHDRAEGGRRVGFIQAGDWLRFDDINLAGIDGISARVSSGATSGIEFHADSPTGPLLATVAVPDTHGFDNDVVLPAVSLHDPGGTRPLFVVFTGPNMDLDEFTFVGRGVTSPATNPGARTSPVHNHAGGAPHPH